MRMWPTDTFRGKDRDRGETSRGWSRTGNQAVRRRRRQDRGGDGHREPGDTTNGSGTLQVSGASNPSREGGPSCTVPPLDAFLMAASAAASACCAGAPASTRGAASACAASQPASACSGAPKSKSAAEHTVTCGCSACASVTAWPSSCRERGAGSAGQLRRPAAAVARSQSGPAVPVFNRRRLGRAVPPAGRSVACVGRGVPGGGTAMRGAVLGFSTVCLLRAM